MTDEENESDTIENVRILYRSQLLGYRFNGFLDKNDVFSGEFVFTSVRQGLLMTFVLPPNSYQRIRDVFSQHADNAPVWIYQLREKTNCQSPYQLMGDLNTNGHGISALNKLTLPLHQLALLQLSTLHPWDQNES